MLTSVLTNSSMQVCVPRGGVFIDLTVGLILGEGVLTSACCKTYFLLCLVLRCAVFSAFVLVFGGGCH